MNPIVLGGEHIEPEPLEPRLLGFEVLQRDREGQMIEWRVLLRNVGAAGE